MNWLKKISQKKPMALPVEVPTKDRNIFRGIRDIDDYMDEETAKNEFNLDPSMSWLGAGSEGIVYESSGKVVKYSRQKSEFDNAIFAYQNKFDWVVPILEQPRQIQENPFLCKIVMKKIQKLTREQEKLIDNMTSRFAEQPETSGPSLYDLDTILEYAIRYIPEQEIINIYNRLEYILEQNSQTLQLTDLHAGNFGWDNDVLKVLDLSF